MCSLYSKCTRALTFQNFYQEINPPALFNSGLMVLEPSRFLFFIATIFFITLFQLLPCGSRAIRLQQKKYYAIYALLNSGLMVPEPSRFVLMLFFILFYFIYLIVFLWPYVDFLILFLFVIFIFIYSGLMLLEPSRQKNLKSPLYSHFV